MDTNAHEVGLLHREVVFTIVGSAMEVLNTLGHGLHEKPYENALVIELGLRAVTVEQQRRFPIFYKTQVVGEFVPDLVVAGAVVADPKVIEKITDHERGRC